MIAAIVITGAPGAGKSSVAQAFTTLLDDAGVEPGAIESEQLAWGTPWLPDLVSLLAAIGASRTSVACLQAPGDVCAARVLAREPERWAGRDALAARAGELAR